MSKSFIMSYNWRWTEPETYFHETFVGMPPAEVYFRAAFALVFSGNSNGLHGSMNRRVVSEQSAINVKTVEQVTWRRPQYPRDIMRMEATEKVLIDAFACVRSHPRIIRNLSSDRSDVNAVNRVFSKKMDSRRQRTESLKSPRCSVDIMAPRHWPWPETLDLFPVQAVRSSINTWVH